MPIRSRRSRVAVLLVLFLAFGIGCSQAPAPAPAAPPPPAPPPPPPPPPVPATPYELVTIGPDCKADKDPAKIYFPIEAKEPTEVVWFVNIPDDWRAEIEGWKKNKYTKYPKDADKKEKLFKKLKHELKDGNKAANSGKAKEARFYPDGKSPVWEYRVRIWDAAGVLKCDENDPGVCVQGGGAACERDI
jgi:hypothetical protein